MFRFLIVPFVLAGLFLVGCDETADEIGKQSVESSKDRAAALERASDVHPLPRTENFPMREALVKYTERQDLLNHPWYIYIANECYQCEGGVSYTYFVGQTYPQSTCNFLSSTEAVTHVEGRGTFVLTAPSLDGIYYGGGGSSGGGCDYFFFDAATDSMQVIQHTWKWFVSDSPLELDATKITVVD